MNDGLLTKKTSITERILNSLEKSGNKLPQPTTLFAILALMVMIGSAVASFFQASVDIQQVDSATGQIKDITITAKSLVNEDGIRFIFENAIANFTGFAPVGIVLVALFGVAAAEGTGLLKALVKKMIYGINQRYITAMIIFLGVLSHVASDAGYVVVIPLGAIIFNSLGKNPLAGIAAGFFGVSGGFSANLLLGSIDPLLGTFSTAGANVLDPSYYVSPTANYYFMAASAFLVVIVGTLVSEKIVEPRLGKYRGGIEEKLEPITKEEARGLKYALVTLLISLGVLFLMILPEGAVLRNQETGDIITNSPFMNSIVIIVTLLFFLPGVFYGIGAKTVKNDRDLLNAMSTMVNTMGSYLILTFVAAQFVAFFKYSNLGTILAVNGADVLKTTGLKGIPLLVVFILLSSSINLFIGSTVTKWSIMAPVFIPMFMMLGFSPELTQLAYRIGDSATHIISPLLPFVGLVLAFADKYQKNIGIGTMMSIMFPYSIILLITWTVFLIIWLLLGVPIGPGVPVNF
ncbi:AbgT family transporter [Brevibacillus sp. SYSU BS000544]|uniref:AbgT family transporter n=1 Tax=Brevibacillus sp. SYSU BS000544 TaxID=3416443 RepID=UPI003CE47F0B